MSLPECLPPSPPHMRASTTHMATSHAHLLVASACCCLRQKGRRFLSNIPSVRARRHPASTSIACGFSAQSSLLLRNIQFKAYYQKWRECILFVAFVSCLAWIGAGGRRREYRWCGVAHAVPTTLRYHPINPIKSELHEGLSLVLACPCPSSILCFAFPFPHPGRTGRTGSIGCLSLSLSCPTVSIWCTCCVRPQCVRSLAFLPCQPCAAVRVEKERARASVPASAATRGATNYCTGQIYYSLPLRWC